MAVDMVQLAIICPLCFLAGFVDTIAGGGGLISLPAYLIAGLPPHFAIATNKLSSGMGNAIAAWQFFKSGYVPWKLATICGFCALIASAFGAQMTLLIDEKTFKYILIIILPLTALYILRSHSLSGEKKQYPLGKTVVISLLVTFVVGAYDGFYGPGSGTFLLLLLTGAAHLSLAQANGVSKVINLMTNLAGLTVLLLNGKVLLLLGFLAGLFTIAGSYLGARSFTKGGAKVAKPVIIFVLTIFMAKVIIELTGVL